MKVLPPKKTAKDKYYIGYFEGDTLVAIMDLIDKYPNGTTIFIGLFMVDRKQQKKGIGTTIIEELEEYLIKKQYQAIRLGYIKGNCQSEAFWKKQQFIETGIITKNEKFGYEIIVLEKNLINNKQIAL